MTLKAIRNQTVWKGTALSNIDMRCCLSRTLTSKAPQYKASSELSYININVGRGGLVIIFGRSGGDQS